MCIYIWTNLKLQRTFAVTNPRANEIGPIKGVQQTLNVYRLKDLNAKLSVTD